MQILYENEIVMEMIFFEFFAVKIKNNLRKDKKIKVNELNSNNSPS